MKKVLIFALVLFPAFAFGAPSVRMLGNNNIAKVAANSGTKITPTKSDTNSGAVSAARLGTLKAKTKTTGVTGAITNSNTRFPIITAAQPYSSVTRPKTDTTTAPSAGVDTDAIIYAVTQNIEKNYYNKDEVYNNNNFIQAVKDVDDPRIDAIKVGAKPVHSAQLPSDYVYIWIEE